MPERHKPCAEVVKRDARTCQSHIKIEVWNMRRARDKDILYDLKSLMRTQLPVLPVSRDQRFKTGIRARRDFCEID